MRFLSLKGLVLLAGLAISSTAAAEDNLWFGIKAGTLGIGGETTWRPIEWLDLRAGVNLYDYDDSTNYAGIDYGGTLALENYYVTGNFRFPLSPFRLTVGAYQNNNEVQLVSVSAPSYLIGNNPTPYQPADVGTLTGIAGFDSVAPYLGAGFDFDIFNRFGLSLDFGVLWQGEPSVSMFADGLLGSDPAFLADLNAEIAELQNEVEDMKAYPVISLGVNFNFF
ncbi:MAG: hypothetical protein KJO82_09890 [Gammaproteobacteria bacterium]|nr:hypothetical protein [Gammaproteobacteria bacterium]